jgi:hypothetical protein
MLVIVGLSNIFRQGTAQDRDVQRDPRENSFVHTPDSVYHWDKNLSSQCFDNSSLPGKETLRSAHLL